MRLCLPDLASAQNPEFANAPSTCCWCGEAELIDIFEVWDDREFQIETCCLALHEEIASEMVDDPKYAADLLNRLGAGYLGRGRARRVVQAQGQLLIDWNLAIATVPFGKAKAFVKAHHRHCPPAAGWKFGAGVYNGLELIGVVMVGRPVARAYDPTTVVEVNRLCVRTDLAEGLSWNACSKLYGWAARLARKRGFHRIISYTTADEPGTTLIAAGWQIDGHVKGRSWNTPSRPRNDKSPIVDKVRWAKWLVKPHQRHMPTRSSDVVVDGQSDGLHASEEALND